MTTPVTEPGLRLTATGPGLRPTAPAGESDSRHHRPVHTETAHRAHAAGAGVFRGIEGFGASSVIHAQRLPSPSEDLPVALASVDTEEAVRAFPPEIAAPTGDCPVTPDACGTVRSLRIQGDQE